MCKKLLTQDKYCGKIYVNKLKESIFVKAIYENRSDDLYCRDSRYTGKTLGYISHLHRHIELGFVKKGLTHVSVDSSEYTAHMLDGSIKRLILDTENLTAKLDGKEYKLTVSGLKYTLKNGEELTFEFNCGDFAYFRQIGN